MAQESLGTRAAVEKGPVDRRTLKTFDLAYAANSIYLLTNRHHCGELRSQA